jgi:L-lactate dehydrogenase
MAPERPKERLMKVGIVGAGAVGAACLTALVARGCAREIVVVNRNRKRAKGLVTDAQYGAVLFPVVELRDGDYADLDGAALVMITAGVNEKTGGATDRNDPAGRLRLLDSNVEAYKKIVPRVHAAAPQAIVLVVTDPPDPLADAVRLLGHERVLSTGTYLDSLRFRFHLARRLGVRPRHLGGVRVVVGALRRDTGARSSGAVRCRPREISRRDRARSALCQHRDH